MGRMGLDDVVRSLQAVYEFHRRYREFLQDTVQGYVFDNEGGDLYVLLSRPCDTDLLANHFRDYDGNVGIICAPKETAERLGQYFSFEEFEKCA